MSYQICPQLGQSFRLVQNAFLQADGLPFADVLSAEQIQEAFEEEGALFGQEEDDVYTPPITLWAWLSQVLHAGELRKVCGGRRARDCAVRRVAARTALPRHRRLLPGPGETAGSLAPATDLRGGRPTGIARPARLALVQPARQTG